MMVEVVEEKAGKKGKHNKERNLYSMVLNKHQ